MLTSYSYTRCVYVCVCVCTSVFVCVCVCVCSVSSVSGYDYIIMDYRTVQSSTGNATEEPQRLQEGD